MSLQENTTLELLLKYHLAVSDADERRLFDAFRESARKKAASKLYHQKVSIESIDPDDTDPTMDDEDLPDDS